MKSRHALPLALLMIVIGAITAAVIFLIDWYPDQASEQAVRVDHLMTFLVIASGIIFTIVTAFLVYSIWRFRVTDPDDESEGSPNHGNTKLEIVWTVLPVCLLAVVAVWALVIIGKNEKKDANREVIQVRALQFAWEFTYPDAGVTTGDLRLPSGRQVELQMRSTDVIHDLYVPEFRVKQDVVPGITTRLIVDPTTPGDYPLICAELCGVGHSVMRSKAIVMPAADYDAWLNQAKAQAAAGGTTTSAASAPDGTPTTTDTSGTDTSTGASGSGTTAPAAGDLPAAVAADPLVRRLAKGRTLPFTVGPWRRAAWRDAVYSKLRPASQAIASKVIYKGGPGIKFGK